jgi:hypothetical protein
MLAHREKSFLIEFFLPFFNVVKKEAQPKQGTRWLSEVSLSLYAFLLQMPSSQR